MTQDQAAELINLVHGILIAATVSMGCLIILTIKIYKG